MPKGVIQDWGLVEFFDPEDTEATQVARNGYVIQGQNIRVHYCIPGVNAINIYMQVRKVTLYIPPIVLTTTRIKRHYMKKFKKSSLNKGCKNKKVRPNCRIRLLQLFFYFGVTCLFPVF